MPHPDETYIVRVRRDEGDAVVEDIRSPRNRRHVRNLSELGALITDWLEPDSGGPSRPPQTPAPEGSKPPPRASAPSPGAPENGGPDDS